ncbi:MAG TPA: adenylosuccinate lyase [Deltaproteobacteria bacterium]|nr:MAG: adenylosuccinate lyase [Deltaproteobacteria bacterium GWA2_55_82]OGQ64003.1 MAG: adenylosuccinate lyase [Deltaproteobacteria bacterium RIFCSPLOWO2_02_FULL_55_12]OIJ73437.1 MAG: adenylosuccinate lyase [Deltaproteobacteria bacterium GWC2_55_46]HBG47300.1 adenylosuccinate lyase [Deltaproteobacteria bacterium]HCY10066.1 adenylosuccinate lyase [Deltaproteobacteria bacterium]
MIERYTRKEMGRIWEPENRFRKWLEVEIAACEAWERLGKIPANSLKTIVRKADFNVARIDEIERTVKHDVIAFLTSVAEFVGPDSRFIHMGLTSSDILDTSLALLLREAADLIIEDIKGLRAALEKKAFEHKNTPTMGRSHGIHAEPMTFGLKMALWYDEMGRNLARMERAKETISYGKLSGAVGTFSQIDPRVEKFVLKKLGLKAESVATQVVHRDRHAEYFTTLALIASSIEKFAVEIRHLQRTEVLEAEEPFTKGQKGSSAMPHKRNPILSENLTGLARLVRGYSVSALENIPLWHERDISHSSVERVIAPDATILVDFMLTRATGLIRDLVVYPQNMLENMDKLKGVVFSQKVLLKLVDKGTTREEAYAIVQRNAMKVWEGLGDFRSLLIDDAEVMNYLTVKEIDSCFDIKPYLKQVDYIFARTFGKKNGDS